MTTKATPRGDKGTSERDLDPLSLSGFQKGRSLAIVIALILVFLVVILLRSKFLAVFPAIFAVIAFGLFLLPGAAVSSWFLPELSDIERLPIAFVISIGIMVIPGVWVMTEHLSLDVFLQVFEILAGISALALIAFYVRRAFVSRIAEDRIRINPLFAVILIALAFGLCFTSLKIPMIGDDWAGMAFLQNFLVSDHINLYEPFHGTSYPSTSRSEFGVWGLDFTLLIRLSGLDPISCYRFMRPLLALVALAAFFLLARQVFSNRTAAAFVTAFWMILLLASMTWGDPGYDLVARINQDKFLIYYILLPVAMFFLLRYFQDFEFRDLFFVGLVGWTSGGVHPIGPVLIGLPYLGFGLFHLSFERDRRTFIHLALAALFFGSGLILPLIQLLGVDEDWLAFSLQNAADPNLLNRLGMATRAGRLWLLPNASYVLHPAAIMNPVILIAMLGLPYLFWQARRNLSARLLFGTLVVIPLLLYFPVTGKAIGRLVTPWMLYRLLWPVSFVAVLTIGWILCDGVEGLINRFHFRTSVRLQPDVLIGLLVVLAGMLVPSILRGQANIKDVSQNPDLAQCQEATPLLERLPAIIKSESLVLADHDLNFCIPAFSPYAKVLEYRWTSTLSRFPTDRRDEAQERVEDMMYFASARFVDEELVSILDRYDIRYILIEEEKPLNLQLRLLDVWFELVAQEGRYLLYRVREARPSLPLVKANTALVDGDRESVQALYKDLLGQSPNMDVLAHIGLSEVYLNQGEINHAVVELKSTSTSFTFDGSVLVQLADTLATAGRYQEAINIYEKAAQRSPRDQYIFQRLGQLYAQAKKSDMALASYEKSADLLAPTGSARWYRILGGMYAESGWKDKAIEAYDHSLNILPKQVDVEVSIGDIYFRNGDMERAREAYQTAAKYDVWATGPILRLGILDEHEDNLPAAIEKYRKAIDLGPTNPTGYLLLAAAIQSTDGADSALQAIQDLPGYELILPGPYLATGMIYAGESQYDRAITELETAIERFPLDTSNLKIALGSLLIETGQDDKAREMFKSGVTDDPGIADVVYILNGRNDIEQAKPKRALGSFYKAVRTDPASANSHLALGDGYSKMAQHGMAIAEYKLAVMLQPSLMNGYIALGDGYLAIGKIQDALDVYQQAVKLFPDESECYEALARAYLRQSRFEEAIQTFHDAETVNPESPTIQISLARTYQDIGDIDEALFQHFLAVEAHPDDPAVQRSLGYFFLAHQEAETAVDAFRKTVKLQPDDGHSRVGLANALLSIGEFDEALEQFQIAAEKGDWTGSASLALGDEYKRRADWNQAAVAYINAIKADPTLVSAYTHLGNLYQDLGNWEAAKEQYQAAIHAQPASGEALTAFGGSLYERGYVKEALEALNKAIKVEPTYADAYTLLSQLLRWTGRPEEALAVNNRLIQILPGSAAGWLAMSTYYREIGQWDEALKADQQAVKIQSGNMEAWISLGSSYQGQGQPKEAEEAFLRAIELQAGRIDGYLALGDLYAQLGKIEEAEEIYNLAAKVDRSQAEPYLKLGEMYGSLGRGREAEGAFLTAVERAPANEQVYIGLGGLYEARCDKDQAQAQYEKAVQIAPASGNARISLGSLYESEGLWQEALDAYQSATRVESSNSAGWVALGDFYHARGKFQDAEKAYSNAIAANVQDPAGHIGLGVLYQEQGRSDEPLDQLLSAVQNSPGSPKALVVLGTWYKEHGEWELAERSFREALKVGPIEVDGLLALGSLYEDKGENRTAAGFYQRAIDIAPMDIAGYLASGELKEKQGAIVAAEVLYRRAVSVAPSDPEGYLHLGALFSAKGDWRQAEEEFESAVVAAPASAKAYTVLGNWYLRLVGLNDIREFFSSARWINRSQYSSDILFRELNSEVSNKEKAFFAFERATEVSPTDLNAYLALARAYKLSGDLYQAQNVYAKGILHSSNTSEAYLARAEFYSSLGDWEQAQADYKAARRLNPESLDSGLSLVDFFYNRGDLTQARLSLNEIVQLQGSSAYTQFELGNIAYAKGDWAEAINAYKEAVRLQKNFFEAYIGLAQISELQGKVEEALRYYQSASDSSPNAPEPLIQLGDAKLDQADYTSARVEFEKARSLDPTNPLALMEIDQVNRIMNQPEVELTGTAELVNANPTSESFVALSRLHQIRGDWDVAGYWLYRALNLDPYDSSNWLELGSYYRILGNWDLALKAYDQALKYESASINSLLALGALQEQLEMPNSAMDTYRQVIDSEPGWIDGYVALANLQFNLEDSEGSLITIQEGISQAPADYRGYDTLGKLYAALGDTTNAMDAYQSGLEIMPGAAELYVGAGDVYAKNVYEALNDLEVAEAFEKGAEYRVEKKEEASKAAITKKEKRVSQITLEHALEDYVNYQDKLLAAQSSYHYSEADLEIALENYNKALALQPNNDAALRGLGKLSLVSKSPEEAVNIFHEAVVAHPSSTLSLIYLGFTYLDANQIDKAMEVFQDLLKFDPNNLYAHMGMAKALSSLDVIDLSQAAASVEHSQFFWDSMVAASRREGIH